ncbi:MAG: hypothetical protein ABGY22_00780, partial [Acidimicrobiales bacterium]
MLYQVIWKEKPDKKRPYPLSPSKKGVFSLKKYDHVTAEYTIVAEYAYKDIDGTGKGSPNGLSLDPEGRAYVTYSYDELNNVVDLIQLLPDGGHKVIVNLHTDPPKFKEDKKGKEDKTKPVGYNDLNAGTYVEENGKPYVIVSNGFANGRGRKVDLTNGTVTDWAPVKENPFGAKEKNVKDYVWVAEGINYRGKTYNIVGLEMDGTIGDTGNVLLASSDPTVKMVTDTVSAPSGTVENRQSFYFGTYGAAFNFKPGGFASLKPSQVFFSNNENAFLTQLTWDDSDGDADGSFTLTTGGRTKETSNNDGGGCAFADDPFPEEVVVDLACVLTKPNAEGSTFTLKITNNGDSPATFYVSVTVNGEHQVVKKVNFDGTTKEFGKVRAPVPIEKTEKFTFDIEWGNKWEAEVELDGEKLAFSPSGGVLNEEACDGKRPPDPEFLPTATLLSVICAEDGGVGVVKVTLDNTQSSEEIDAVFVVYSIIDDMETTVFPSDVTVEAGESKPLTFEVSHASVWSLEWQASDPKGVYDPVPVVGSLSVDGLTPVDCPPVDRFAPTVEVEKLVCSAPPPHVVTVFLNNSKSTVGAAFTVVSNIDGTDNTEYDDTVEAEQVDTVRISIPEDANWSVSWTASDNKDVFEPVEGREPLSSLKTADCTGSPPTEIVGNVYGYVWVDWDKSGTRTGIEDGVEEHVAGAVATLTNTTNYLEEDGQVRYGPGGYVRTAITGDG